MSPFARLLKQFRLSRKLKQKDLADLLGYEPSYLSALERSVKGPPRHDFVQKLTQGLDLGEQEKSELEKALMASNRQLTIPAQASDEEYEIWCLLGPRIGHLSPKQVTLIRLALELEFQERLPGTGRRISKDMDPRCSARKGEPKM